jgi:hypothetical protein
MSVESLILFTVQGEPPTAEANSPVERKPLHNHQPRGGILLGIAVNQGEILVVSNGEFFANRRYCEGFIPAGNREFSKEEWKHTGTLLK